MGGSINCLDFFVCAQQTTVDQVKVFLGLLSKEHWWEEKKNEVLSAMLIAAKTRLDNEIGQYLFDELYPGYHDDSDCVSDVEEDNTLHMKSLISISHQYCSPQQPLSPVELGESEARLDTRMSAGGNDNAEITKRKASDAKSVSPMNMKKKKPPVSSSEPPSPLVEYLRAGLWRKIVVTDAPVVSGPSALKQPVLPKFTECVPTPPSICVDFGSIKSLGKPGVGLFVARATACDELIADVSTPLLSTSSASPIGSPSPECTLGDSVVLSPEQLSSSVLFLSEQGPDIIFQSLNAPDVLLTEEGSEEFLRESDFYENPTPGSLRVCSSSEQFNRAHGSMQRYIICFSGI